MNNIATKLSAQEWSSVIHFLQKGSQMDYIRRVTQVSHTTHQKISKDGPKKTNKKQTTQQPQKDKKTERSRLQKKTNNNNNSVSLWAPPALVQSSFWDEFFLCVH